MFDGRWTLISSTRGEPIELYDLTTDPRQESNVSAAHPEVVFQLAHQVQITDINDHGLEMFGAETKEEILGALDTVFDAASFPVFMAQMVAVANGEDHIESEAYARTLDGKPI